mmetsp:Transcript_132356/g.229516  ORF Transcript_132356/g.229516 Transcript_132356/m.229516 type:complete len:130 (-) Transcript_132356:78-467(-)
MKLRILLVCVTCFLTLSIEHVEPIVEQFVESDEYSNVHMGDGAEMYDMDEMEGDEGNPFFEPMSADGFDEGMDPALVELLQQMFGGGAYEHEGGDDFEGGGDGGYESMYMDNDDYGGQWRPDPDETYED